MRWYQQTGTDDTLHSNTTFPDIDTISHLITSHQTKAYTHANSMCMVYCIARDNGWTWTTRRATNIYTSWRVRSGLVWCDLHDLIKTYQVLWITSVWFSWSMQILRSSLVQILYCIWFHWCCFTEQITHHNVMLSNDLLKSWFIVGCLCIALSVIFFF